MDFGSLWEETCSLLKAQMNYVSYTTWVEDNMIPYYPLGVYKDKTSEEGEK